MSYNADLPVSYITVAKDIGGEVEEVSTHDVGAKAKNVRFEDKEILPQYEGSVSDSSIVNVEKLKSHLKETFSNINATNKKQDDNLKENSSKILDLQNALGNKVNKETRIADLPIMNGITDSSLRAKLNYQIAGIPFNNNGYMNGNSLLSALGIKDPSAVAMENGENSFYVFECGDLNVNTSSGTTYHYFDILATQPRNAQNYIFGNIWEDNIIIKDCLFFIYFPKDIKIDYYKSYYLRDTRNETYDPDDFFMIKNFTKLAENGIIKGNTYYALKGINLETYGQCFLEALPNFFAKNSDVLKEELNQLKGANIYFLDAWLQEGTTSVYDLDFKFEPNFLKDIDTPNISQMPIDLDGSILAVRFKNVHSAVNNKNTKTYFDFNRWYSNSNSEGSSNWYEEYRRNRIRTYNDEKINFSLANGYEINPYSYSTDKLYIYYYTSAVIGATSYTGGSAFLIDIIDLSGEEPTVDIPVAINRIYKIDTRLYYEKTDGSSGYVDLEAQTTQAFATYRKDLCRNQTDESVGTHPEMENGETALTYYTVDYHVFYINEDFNENKLYFIDAIEGEYPNNFTSGKIKHRCVFVNKNTLNEVVIDVAERASSPAYIGDIQIGTILLYQDGEIIIQ